MRGGLERESALLDAFLIIAAGVLVVAGAWSADFLAYDDPDHIPENPQLAPEVSILSYFEPKRDEAFFPVTLLSWRLDRFLFSTWMPGSLGSWAPGVRSMNWLYHTLAALALWRVFLELGLSRRASLFLAAAFALHPTACETVCWATERKNALAGLFGFLTLWLWLRLERQAAPALEASARGGLGRLPPGAARVSVCLFTYALALMSKSSALGLLPVLALVDCFGGGAGLRGETGRGWTADLRSRWRGAVRRLLPFAALSAAFVYLGIRGHGSWMAEPPGGSACTALLTDAWILPRYLSNLLAPVALSAAYAIEPIDSLSSGRLWAGAGILLAAVGVSLWLARSPRRAAFGWLWFVGALGPSLNLIALPAVMTDRYLYLALPGFFLVLAETVAGLWREADREETRRPRQLALTIVASAYLAFLGTLSLQRSMLWRETLELFADAVKKEPRSAYAHYGLGMCYKQAWFDIQQSSDPLLAGRGERYRELWIREWTKMFDAVDLDRQLYRADVAFELGAHYREQGADERARRFLELALECRGGVAEKPAIRSQAFLLLAALEVRARRGRSALEYFDASARFAEPVPEFRLLRAHAHLLLAQAAGTGMEERRRQEGLARNELGRIPKAAPEHAKAEELLQQLDGAKAGKGASEN